MNGLNGLETAAKVRKVDGKCILIFLTSSKEFMPKAFSFHSFEYIIKPFSYKRFECDVKNVRKNSLKRISFPSIIPPIAYTSIDLVDVVIETIKLRKHSAAKL